MDVAVGEREEPQKRSLVHGDLITPGFSQFKIQMILASSTIQAQCIIQVAGVANHLLTNTLHQWSIKFQVYAYVQLKPPKMLHCYR